MPKTFKQELKKDLAKNPFLRKAYERECLMLDIELVLRRVITRKTHKGSAGRVVIQTAEAILKLVDEHSDLKSKTGV